MTAAFSELTEAADLLKKIRAAGLAGTSAGGETQPPAGTAEGEITPRFRGDRLEQTLSGMCGRGGFSGAVLADENGFPLAAYNNPVHADKVAAFTAVLGGAVDRAAFLLETGSADNISMDINFEDKIVLKRFTSNDAVYSILVICPQSADERGELEVTIGQLAAMI